jgi:hypothetical protein
MMTAVPYSFYVRIPGNEFGEGYRGEANSLIFMLIALNKVSGADDPSQFLDRTNGVFTGDPID